MVADIIEALKNQPSFYFIGEVSIDEIEQAETLLQTKFAPDYRNYILAFGAASFSGREWTGVCCSDRLNVVPVTQELRQYNKTVPPTWYVLEQTCIDGIVIWQSTAGVVYQTYPNGDIHRVCDSLLEYLYSSFL